MQLAGKVLMAGRKWRSAFRRPTVKFGIWDSGRSKGLSTGQRCQSKGLSTGPRNSNNSSFWTENYSEEKHIPVERSFDWPVERSFDRLKETPNPVGFPVTGWFLDTLAGRKGFRLATCTGRKVFRPAYRQILRYLNNSHFLNILKNSIHQSMCNGRKSCSTVAHQCCVKYWKLNFLLYPKLFKHVII